MFCKLLQGTVCVANISEVNDDIVVLKGDIGLKGMYNQEIMLYINSHLDLLSEKQRVSLIKPIYSNSELFADHPSVTNSIMHDIEVEGAAPIRSHPYRVNAEKKAKIKQKDLHDSTWNRRNCTLGVGVTGGSGGET